jgi:hypothetical protein
MHRSVPWCADAQGGLSGGKEYGSNGGESTASTSVRNGTGVEESWWGKALMEGAR